MSHYVIIHSDGSKRYFPDNTSCHFRTHFQSILDLEGIWKVALVEINLATTTPKTKQNLYVYSNICGESFVDGEKENLLRVLRAQKIANWSQTFDSPFYVSVNKSEIRDIEIVIKTGKGNLASFLTDRATIVLHCKQYPFLS